MTSPINPVPIPGPSQPLPDPQDMATWSVRMAEMHRWMREDAAPGMNGLGGASYANALAAQEQALIAMASANFKGPWSSLSGALAMPASVYHNGRFWALMTNLPSVSASEPGVSVDWVESGGVKRSDVLLRLGVSDALPSSDIGPIWHDGYAAIMTWRTIGAYEGYASVNLGEVSYFDAQQPPVGWLASAGQLLSGAYAALNAYRGSNTLRDLRGEFIRGWDDGRGVDVSRAFGSAQADAIQTGSFDLRRDSTGVTLSTQASGSMTQAAVGASDTGTVTANAATSIRTRVTIGSAAETRPRNIALLTCIKY